MSRPTPLDILCWEATVQVYEGTRSDYYYYSLGTPPPVQRYWEVTATWDDFHGAMLQLRAEGDTITEAVEQIAAAKMRADAAVRDKVPA